MIKQMTILFAFLIISLSARCDTLDYWHVYINDSLIAEFNSFSEDLSIKLKADDLKSSDTISVRYGTDHPCIDCYYGITVFAEIKQKAPEVETKEHFGKLSFAIKDLLDLRQFYEINTFNFNYYERRGIEKRYSNIFRLTIT